MKHVIISKKVLKGEIKRVKTEIKERISAYSPEQFGSTTRLRGHLDALKNIKKLSKHDKKS